ncbi:MAG: DUF5689 domain-containing protein [Flavobacteriaceae bacterium]|jgi:hypothetical protein|nr:DUF5689 domain-containing protein [Flavobacteriaceae bacterium]
MKRFIKNILILSILPLVSASCVHDDDYNAPEKGGSSVCQTLTPTTDIPSIIAAAPAGVAAMFAKDSQVVEGYVISSDASGNIYKNMYIVTADGKTGLQLSVNQSNLYNHYPLGSKVYVHLDSLYYGKQYDMTMIGTLPTQPSKYVVDQIPSGLIAKHIILSCDDAKNDDDLVIKTNAAGNPLTMADLNDSYLNTLVEITGAAFTDAGGTFVRGNITTDNYLVGTPSVDVRVSNYSDFANLPIPFGKGTIRGILTKYTTYYQLMLRSYNDVTNFSGERAIFSETFNNVADVANRPKLGVATGFDNGNPVTYSDVEGRADIRQTAALNPHVWLPANYDSYVTISGINTTGYHNLRLQYSFAANGVTDTDKLIVRCNGVDLTVPSQAITTTNTFVYIELPDDIPSANAITIEFYAKASNNTVGFRLDNVVITGIKN